MLTQGITGEDEITKGLTHLLAIEPDQTGVHPDLDERTFPSHRLRLSDFTRVVGEDEIGTTTVDIDLITKVACGHRTALDMPTRSTQAPGTLPLRISRSTTLPEHKVERITLTQIVWIVPTLVCKG